MNGQKSRILIPVDGSLQALHAVLYAGRMFPPDRTEIVLFHIDAESPDLDGALTGNPLYYDKKVKMNEWMAWQQKAMKQYLKQAISEMMKLNFPQAAICVKIKKKRERLLDEILKESRKEYNSVVVGKTGKSALKDRIVGSLAVKLAGKMNHIPLIIVDGAPRTDKLLLTIDRQTEAFKSLDCISALLDIQKMNISICHVAKCALKQDAGLKEITVIDDHYMCPLHNVECICPSIEKMKKCLEDEGIIAEHLSEDIIDGDNPVASIIEFSRFNQFGSIVVGRRAIVPFVEELISGRSSEKILKKMRNMALWLVS